MRDMELLATKLKELGIGNVIFGDSVVTLACAVKDSPIEVKIYFEKANFQINVGDLLVIDKIEDQDLEYEDIEDILSDFLIKLQEGQIEVYVHKVGGLQKFSIFSAGQKHIQYLSIFDSFVIRAGKKSRLGRLRLIE